jgi:hypothetical protein
VKILGSYPLSTKTQLSTMLSLESTLLRPTPKIANYSSYWVCISARRGFSASPPGVREPNSIYKKHIMTKQKYNTTTKNLKKNRQSRTLQEVFRRSHTKIPSAVLPMMNKLLREQSKTNRRPIKRGSFSADSGSRTLCSHSDFAPATNRYVATLENTYLFCRC